ncbi:hypothetical protein BZM27_23300 [Paraburkholderia steynii]|uniref:Uncharacterized protein n=1 Tax=Paraburkholderia steynii TaxID=1245441 RepID=A0A4R0XDS2_9BURK|nr:hypothetical protein BZM27_23300 [Paraburkholderia steynii]
MLVACERAEKRVLTINPATRKPMAEIDWRAKVEEVAVEIFASLSPSTYRPHSTRRCSAANG